jgi:pseudaminic acid synthase
LEEVNLNTIPMLREKFGVQIGLSDHTIGYVVPMGSVALGAILIEKHFIMDRSVGGPDSAFSMEPSEFEQMIKNIRDVEKAMGVATLELSAKSLKNREFARSLYIVNDMAEGDVFSKENIRSIRPAFGLSPRHLNEIIGKKATKALEKGTPASWDLIG